MPSSPIEAVADRFQVLEEIGCGSFGVVYKAIERETGKVVAIKHIDLEASEDDIAEIQQEISVLGTCASPHVTRYYGSFIKGYKLWIVMEYLGGGSGVDLLKPAPFSEPHIAAVCKEILLGLEYLHTEGKIHRDIKAANILFSSQGAVKLADFGVATQLSHMKSTRNTFVGTPFWMAPEVIEQSGYGFKADIWSLGITAMEFANGEPPHATIHPMKVLFMIPKEPAPRLTGPNFSPAFKDFVAQCLTKDPLKRPSARELLKHKFIKSAPKVEAIQELIERKERWSTNGKIGRKSDEIKFYQETVKAKRIDRDRKHGESDDEESGWIFESVKQRDTLVRKPPCEELRTIARKSSPSQQDAALKTVNLNREQRSERRKRASSGTRVVSGTMIRTKTPPSRMHTPPSRTRTPQSKPSTPRPRSNGPTLITPEMVFGKDGVRAFSGELASPVVSSPARRAQKDSGVGIPLGKPERRDSYAGVFHSAFEEIQSVHLPVHEQVVLAQLDSAWSNLALISPELESALLARLVEKVQRSPRPNTAPTPPPVTRLPPSPPRPLPTPPPAKHEKITVPLPPPTPPEDESEKRQYLRREALRRAASDSSNQSSDSKPSLSGETVVEAYPPMMQAPSTPHAMKSPKDRKEKNRKRRSFAPTDLDAALEKERERGRDREKEELKEGKERRKRDSMHEHLTNYTEQLESMLYGQWLNRLGARWPLAHVGAGGAGK